MRIAESPAGRIRDESGQADCRESIINRSAEIIREWMINGSAPGEYALSELYETARSAARDGLAAEDAVRACGRAARSGCVGFKPKAISSNSGMPSWSKSSSAECPTTSSPLRSQAPIWKRDYLRNSISPPQTSTTTTK